MRLAFVAAASFLAAATSCDRTGPDRGNGSVLWRVQRFVVTDRMVVRDSAVIVGTYDGSLISVDRLTGRSRWEIKLDNSNFFFGRVLRYGDGLVYAAPYALSAVDPASGAVRWTYRVLVPGGEDVARYPAAQGDALYVSSQYGYVARLNATTGAVEWLVDLGEAVFPATVTDTLVLVGTRSFVNPVTRDGGLVGPGRVVALSRADGRIVWQVQVPDSAGFPGSGGVTTEPLVMGDVVIVGTQSSHVLGLRFSDGTRLWDHSDGSPVVAPYGNAPVAFGDVAVILRSDGLLEALDPTTGRRLWRLGSGGFVSTMPQVVAGRLYVVMQANLWIIGPGGEVLWRYGARENGYGLPFFGTGPTVGDDGTIYAGWTDEDGNAFVGAILPPPSLR